MKHLRFALPVCLLLFPGVVAAQDAAIPERLSLADAVRIASERNPSVVAARALIDVAEANRLDARLRPNPALSIESEGYPLFASPRPGFINGQEFGIRLDQEIETAGRRRLRVEAATTAVSAATLTARDYLRQLELAVRRAYLHLGLAQANAEVARASLLEIDRALTVSRERVKVGEAARSEISRLEVERLRFAEDAFAADLALRNARATLLTLLGAADLSQTLVAADALFPPVAAASGAGLPSTIALDSIQTDSPTIARPDLLAAREERARAATETRLQRALRTPNITMGGGYKRDFGTNGVLFGVTLPLPLWNRNQGAVARALAEERIAESRVAATELDVRLDVQHAINAVETSRARADYIEQQVLASARESRDVVSESYRLGAADLIDFLDAQRAFRDTLRSYYSALFEYRMSLFELQAARGATTIK